MDKGYTYRVSVVGEVNLSAVLRSEAINIRDFAGAALLEEEKTVLYYAIRVIQDYLEAGILSMENLQGLSPELLAAIEMDNESLKPMQLRTTPSLTSTSSVPSSAKMIGRICSLWYTLAIMTYPRSRSTTRSATTTREQRTRSAALMKQKCLRLWSISVG